MYFHFLNSLHKKSILVEYIKVHKKIETIWRTFDKGKRLLIQKTICLHDFLECFKHIKGLLYM
jgi:hypothetical protein